MCARMHMCMCVRACARKCSGLQELHLPPSSYSSPASQPSHSHVYCMAGGTRPAATAPGQASGAWRWYRWQRLAGWRLSPPQRVAGWVSGSATCCPAPAPRAGCPVACVHGMIVVSAKQLGRSWVYGRMPITRDCRTSITQARGRRRAHHPPHIVGGHMRDSCGTPQPSQPACR